MSVLFMNNKYSIWYNSIIFNAQQRVNSKETYVERHHIIPRALGGDNQKTNLVDLSPREHFICHWLLTKMTTGCARYKMLYALGCMQRASKFNQRVLSSWQYDICRKAISVARSSRTGIQSTKKGKQYGKQANPCQTPRARWYNNGLTDIKSHRCPEGWCLGRISKKWWTDGVNDRLSINCPQEGWFEGRSSIKDKPQTIEHKTKRLNALRLHYANATV